MSDYKIYEFFTDELTGGGRYMSFTPGRLRRLSASSWPDTWARTLTM